MEQSEALGGVLGFLKKPGAREAAALQPKTRQNRTHINWSANLWNNHSEVFDSTWCLLQVVYSEEVGIHLFQLEGRRDSILSFKNRRCSREILNKGSCVNVILCCCQLIDRLGEKESKYRSRAKAPSY